MDDPDLDIDDCHHSDVNCCDVHMDNLDFGRNYCELDIDDLDLYVHHCYLDMNDPDDLDVDKID